MQTSKAGKLCRSKISKLLIALSALKCFNLPNSLRRFKAVTRKKEKGNKLLDCKVSAFGFMSSLVLYYFGYNATILWTLRVNLYLCCPPLPSVERSKFAFTLPPMLTQVSAGNLLERPPHTWSPFCSMSTAHLLSSVLLCTFAFLHFLHFFTFALFPLFHSTLHTWGLLLICFLCNSLTTVLLCT